METATQNKAGLGEHEAKIEEILQKILTDFKLTSEFYYSVQYKNEGEFCFIYDPATEESERQESDEREAQSEDFHWEENLPYLVNVYVNEEDHKGQDGFVYRGENYQLTVAFNENLENATIYQD